MPDILITSRNKSRVQVGQKCAGSQALDPMCRGNTRGGMRSAAATCSLSQRSLTALESKNQDALGWKTPLRPSNPAVNLTLSKPPLNYVPMCHIYTSSKDGDFIFSEQHITVLDDPFRGEFFSHIQFKPCMG